MKWNNKHHHQHPLRFISRTPSVSIPQDIKKPSHMQKKKKKLHTRCILLWLVWIINCLYYDFLFILCVLFNIKWREKSAHTIVTKVTRPMMMVRRTKERRKKKRIKIKQIENFLSCCECEHWSVLSWRQVIIIHLCHF